MPAARLPQPTAANQPAAMPPGGTSFSPRQPRQSAPSAPQGESYEELVDLMMMADEAGDANAAAEFAEMIDNRQYKEAQNDLVSAGLGFSEGSTLGYGKNIAASLRAGIEHAVEPYVFAAEQSLRSTLGDREQPEQWREASFGELVDQRYNDFFAGKDYMQRYNETLSGSKNMLETARREDPYATFGGELVGGAGLTAAPAAAAVRGPGMLKNLLRLGGVGAVEGGVAGYGYSDADPIASALDEDRDDASEQVQRAALDAGITASIGGGLSVVAPLGASLARSVARKVSAPFTRNAKIKEAARREIEEAIREDLINGNMTLAQAQKELRDTPGMTVADLGPALQDLTETLVNRPTEGSRQLATFLQGRNKEQYARLQPKISEALTGKGEDTFAVAYRNLMTDMKTKSNAAYEAAYEVPVRMTQPMKNIMDTKLFKGAIKEANDLRSLDGKAPLPKIRVGQMMRTKDLDEVIKGMDTVVGQKYRKGKGAVGGRLKDLRNDFRESIYKQNELYRDARKTWANDKLNEEAMDKGLRLFNDDADIVAEAISDMSNAEKTYFKIGALRAITRKLGNKSETADMSKGLWQQPNAQSALRVAFDNKEKFDDFMRYVGQEQKMYNTYHKAVGNSGTARRIAQQQVAEGGGLAYALGYLGSMQLMPNMPMGLAGALSRRGYEQLAAPSKNQIAAMNRQSVNAADMLMSNDLQSLMRPHSVGGLLDTGIPASGAAATTGLLGTGAVQPEVEYGEF